jgi:hypothetical protein
MEKKQKNKKTKKTKKTKKQKNKKKASLLVGSIPTKGIFFSFKYFL